MARRYWLSASFLALGMASSVVLTSRPAQAATCTGDADCGKGFTCQVVGTSGCPGIACPEGEKCPLPPECVDPIEYRECVPAACQTDADCADGMVCLEYSSTSCTGSAPACPPNEECPKVEPTPDQCTTTTTHTCAPKYVAPCTVDADCGDGFTCVDTQECSCSASGGSATPGSDPAPTPEPAPPPDCSCTNTGKKHCEMKQISCADATQCPSGWSCEAYGTGDCAQSSDGQRTCEPTTTSNMCMPPYYNVPGVAVAEDGSFTSGAPSSGEAAGKDAPPAAPGSGSTASGDAESDGGCQVGHGTTGGSAGGLLLMLGLFAMRRRKQG